MSTEPRPLDGFIVVDMTMYVAGPLCTQLLADMGAEVIKVEPPAGDVYRRQGPEFLDGESISFLALNKAKKSMVVDAKSPEGSEILARLLKSADVFVHNFRPGTAQRLGLGQDEVAEINPDVIYASVSGYGGVGPKAAFGGYDLMMQGEAGLMEATGYPDRPPAKAGMAVVDINAAYNLAFGITTALLARERAGPVRTVESSLYETAIAMGVVLAERYLANGSVPGRNGSASPLFSPYEAYQTSDGYFTVEGTGPPGAWERFCDAIDAPELYSDPNFATNGDRVRNQESLRAAVERRTFMHSTEHWIRRMEELGLPCGPIRTIGAALDSEQTAALGMVAEVPHPAGGTYRTLRNAIRLDGNPVVPAGGAPRLGQHTREVLNAIGYGSGQVDELVTAGAVVCEPIEEVE